MNKMYKFEYLISWEAKNGTQVSYAYTFAQNKSEAKRKILSRIPYQATIDYNAHYSVASYDDNVILWYFDQNKVEHHEIY